MGLSWDCIRCQYGDNNAKCVCKRKCSSFHCLARQKEARPVNKLIRWKRRKPKK